MGKLKKKKKKKEINCEKMIKEISLPQLDFVGTEHNL